MKLIDRIVTFLLPISMLFASCSDNSPISVAGPDDEPHILAPTFPDRVNGELPTIATLNRDGSFSMELVVTPADYVEVVWNLDGKEVATGKTIDISLLAGSYEMKVVVTTLHGKSTSRQGMIRVNPLPEDPWTEQIELERIIAPGSKAVLYGRNLDLVSQIRIGETLVADFELVTDEGEDYLTYLVPLELNDEEQRVVLIDAEGMEYGGDKVTVSSKALITSGAERTTANASWNLTGINLDKVTSFTIDGNVITSFTKQTATSIVFVVPNLEDGEYLLTGQMASGESTCFWKGGKIYTETQVIVSSSQILWSGHHYVSWDLPDDSPNKTFNLVGKDQFASVKAGTVMTIHYSVEPTAEYHQIRTTSGHWNDLPGTAVVEFTTDGSLEVTLTQAMLDMIQEQDGFLCVGHGYYVDLITLK